MGFAISLFSFVLPRFDGKVIAVPVVVALSMPLAFAVWSFGEAQLIHADIRLYVVRSAGNSPLFPFLGATQL